MAAGRFVLENRNGEVVRTFALDSDSIYIVYRHDNRRIEVVSNLKGLEAEEVSYEVLKQTKAGAVKKRAIPLGNGNRFRYLSEISKVFPSIQLKDDSSEQEANIYKYTALTQCGAILLIFIIGLLIEPWLFPRHEEEVITVVPQQVIQKTSVPTVKAAEHKVDPKQKIGKKKVVSPVKHTPKTLTAKVKSPRKENAPLRTKVQVEKSGALSVLGGTKTGSKSSAGFNMKAANDSRGTSWNGSSAGGVGGMERAIPGQGLVASTMGQGSHIEGGGGYGTRGKAGGGRPGYGEMNMGGSAAAYFEPLEEEAMVEGGLDKAQIAAVINRHMGEVLYCYEKGLQVQPNLAGRVAICWVINGGGVVNGANIESTSLKSAQVEGCIVNHLRTWQFPKPVGGVNVKVSYPFVLKRTSHG